jgi:hypothetical protein
MPGWIQRNEDINYLQEGRDKARAWKTLLTYNITHLVMDDNDARRCVPTTCTCSTCGLVPLASLGIARAVALLLMADGMSRS